MRQVPCVVGASPHVDPMLKLLLVQEGLLEGPTLPDLIGYYTHFSFCLFEERLYPYSMATIWVQDIKVICKIRRLGAENGQFRHTKASDPYLGTKFYETK